MVNFLVPDVKVMPSEVVLPNFQRPRESGIQNVTGDDTSDSSCDELLFVTEHAVAIDTTLPSATYLIALLSFSLLKPTHHFSKLQIDIKTGEIED